MLISPPFLPAPLADDEAFVASAMPDGVDIAPNSGNAPLGSYPLTTALTWHNGLHIRAPRDAQNQPLPVRAIADGTVIFKREPRTPNGAANDPQNYNPYGQEPAWTDNGIVIVRHTTEVGATDVTPSTLIYYSVYMHLSRIEASVVERQPVWRKDALGIAGRILGRENHLHFEICISPAQLQNLLGTARPTTWTDPAVAPRSDGRSDSVFGSVYIYLPAGTPTSSSRPISHLRGTAAVATSAAANPSLGVLSNAQWVEIQYHGGRGSVRSYRADGVQPAEPIGAVHDEPEFEYNMYTEACARHNSLGAAIQAVSSPSGWYELLRFGRNLGPDRLPANAAHWREIPTSSGTVWADLNAPGTFKFSDADFPGFMGWQCFDDDPTHDNQRCDSQHMKRLLSDPRTPETTRERKVLARRLGVPEVRKKLWRTICKFPTEWDRTTIAQRYDWLKADDEFRVEDGQAWNEFKAHAESISFDGLPQEYKDAVWHLHPRMFIAHMRKCGWLSQTEMVQCIPRNSPAGTVSLSVAKARVATWSASINRMTRKFGMDSIVRLNHLLAHVWAETGYLRLMKEANADHARYAPYVGRGLIQITWRDKYENYNEFAKITPSGEGAFDLELIAVNSYHAGNSSGFYWASKFYKDPSRISKIGLSRIADEGVATDSIGKLCLWINGGGNHYDHRHIHFFFIKRVLDDVIYPATPVLERVTFSKVEFEREVVISNGRRVEKIIGSRISNASMSVEVNFVHQR